MIELSAYGLIALMGVFVMPKWSFMPYDVPRQTLIAIGAFVLLAFALRSDAERLSGWAVLLSPMVGWWVIASILSKRPDMSFERAIQFFSCMAVGILAAHDPGSRAGLGLVAAAGTISAAYGILQWHFDFLLMKKIESVMYAEEACGFTRNTNFHGPWLVLTLLVTLRLLAGAGPAEGIIIGAAAAVQAYGIWCARCRTAFLGLTGAFIYFGIAEVDGYIAGLGFLLFGFIVLSAFRGRAMKVFSNASLRDRRTFLILFFDAIKRRPVIGYGFDVVKTQMPGITMELNERTGGKILDPKNYEAPVVRKAHNDIMQHLCDVGAVGLALALGTLSGMVNRPDPFFMGLVVVFLVMGLTFHQMYWLPTQCLFWLAWASMVDPGLAVSAPPAVSIAFMLLLGLGILLTVVRTQVADVCHWMGNWAVGEERRLRWLIRSAQWKKGSIAMIQASNELARMKNVLHSCAMLHKIVDRYDGDTKMWIIMSCLGELYLATGCLTLARIYHEQAVGYWPEWAFGKKRLELVRKMEASLGNK